MSWGRFGASSALAEHAHGFPRVTAGSTEAVQCQKLAEFRAIAFVDIAGVASSILATPTIKEPAFSMSWRAFSCFRPA